MIIYKFIAIGAIGLINLEASCGFASGGFKHFFASATIFGILTVLSFFVVEVKLWGQLVFSPCIGLLLTGSNNSSPNLGIFFNKIIWKVLLQQYHKQGRFHKST